VYFLQNYQAITSYAQGLHAEGRALKHLETLGMTCIAKRFKTPYGEIDLLMQEGPTIVAV
jgi:Holliday junction resolvase-like predicted endonuclease